MALNLQLFRNATLFATRELARKGLETQLESSADGEIVLARYGTEVANAKTIFGIAYNKSGVEAGSSYTIFDLEDIKKGSCLASAKFNDVVGDIASGAEGLNLTFKVLSKDITVGAGYEPVVLGTVTGGTLSSPIAVGDTIQSALHKLEVDVKGLVDAINAEKDRAEAAEAKLQGSITTNTSEIGKLKDLVGTTSVSDQITAKINTLDSASSGTGSFVTGVSQTDGKVSVTKGQGQASDVTVDATTAGITSTNVQAALKELKEDITGQATVGAVTVEALGSPEGGAAKTYVVKQGGNKVGVSINIPKDMVVQSGAIVKGTWDRDRTTFTPSEEGSDIALKLTIGNGSPVYVDVKQLVDAYTGANGINISNLNEISVKINATGNEYLEVGADGLRVTGVNAAITSKVNTAIGNLDVADTAVPTDYVSSVSQTDGKIKVTRAKLPVIPVIGDATKSGASADGHVKVDVTTTKGVVSAVAVTGTDIASAAKVNEIEGAYFAKANVTTTVPSNGIGVDTKVMSEKLVVAELKKKQATLVSGTNIKTVNGESLLGKGNIDTPKTAIVNDLTTGGTDKALSAEQGKVLKGLVDGKQIAGDYATKTELTTGLGKKQDTLVSGTNIKTVNGESLLGKGNIDTPKTAIVNDLTTGGTDKALSAAQGKVLKGLVDGKQAAGDYATKTELATKLDKTGPIDCGTY